ncbi:MAG: tetratricopeptide repeat protein, partial [Gammaproteobacteria bacterium]|nr:tetratricopeptide repeat protein [Gammaproteobacteria bacterium]
MSQRFNLLCSGLFFAVLGTGFLVYMGGLHGPFLFDDFVNLDRLDKYGALNNLSSVLDYLFGGLYGTGRLVSSRPVAFASFLLDTGSWPSDPYPFKYHNLLFHLLAAVALFWFSLLISRCMGFYHRTACLIALTTMALWTLHPLHVSTVLYAVQRMTILSALFVLFGLGLYLSGRLDLAAARTRRGFG